MRQVGGFFVMDIAPTVTQKLFFLLNLFKDYQWWYFFIVENLNISFIPPMM
jgi:hypothetical protein